MPRPRLDHITEAEIRTLVRACVAEDGWYTPGFEIDFDKLREHVQAAVSAAVQCERARQQAKLERAAAALERAIVALRA